MTKVVNYLTNLLTGLEGEPGIAYSYITAANGLFIRAKNENLSVTMNIGEAQVRGLAPVYEDITLLHGKISLVLLNMALSILCEHPETEKYLAITWEGGYRLRETPQEAGPTHVTYEIMPNTVLDIHSHTGSMPAQFSSVDDFDEKGFMIYAVAADMRNLFPTVEFRLGCYGYYLPLAREEIFA